MRATNKKINFLSKGHSTYLRVKNLRHKQSEKAYMGFKTRRASTRDFTVYFILWQFDKKIRWTLAHNIVLA